VTPSASKADDHASGGYFAGAEAGRQDDGRYSFHGLYRHRDAVEESRCDQRHPEANQDAKGRKASHRHGADHMRDKRAQVAT
jgi:hypothetical protein